MGDVWDHYVLIAAAGTYLGSHQCVERTEAARNWLLLFVAVTVLIALGHFAPDCNLGNFCMRCCLGE
jgi:hypothetical protein